MKALTTNRSLLTRIPNLILQKSLGGQGITRTTVPEPKIAANELLIQVRTTALNPIDLKCIDFLAPPGSLAGCDFAGIVTAVGSAAAAIWKVGDRVAGFVQGGIDNEYGAFAEFVKAEQDLVWRIPEGVEDTQAATYGVPAAAALQALYLHLGVPWEAEMGKKAGGENTVFIYAGSTAVGLFAIQMAKKAGWMVVTTASPHSFKLVKGYGADHVFDYRAPRAVEDIFKEFPDMTKALDCISTAESTGFCGRVLEKKGGKVITLLDSKVKVPAGVEVKNILCFTLLGKAFSWLAPVGPKFPVSAEDRAALVRFYKGLSNGLGKEIRAPPVTAMEGGFDGVLGGLERLRSGKVSGSKLVVNL